MYFLTLCVWRVVTAVTESLRPSIETDTPRLVQSTYDVIALADGEENNKFNQFIKVCM